MPERGQGHDAIACSVFSNVRGVRASWLVLVAAAAMACLSHSQLVPGIVKPLMAALAGRNAVITAQGRWSTDEERESLLAIVTEQGSDTRRMNEALRGVARDVLRRPFGLTRNPNPFGWMMVAGVGATGVIAGRPADRFGVGYFRYSAPWARRPVAAAAVDCGRRRWPHTETGTAR